MPTNIADVTDLLDYAIKRDVAPQLPTIATATAGGDRRRYRTIWISDVHLGTRGCNAGMLVDFLDRVDSDTMYLVGDMIDGWRLKKKFYWPPLHNDVVRRLMKRAKSIFPVITTRCSASSLEPISAASRSGARRSTKPPMAAACWYCTGTNSTRSRWRTAGSHTLGTARTIY
jgi:hypothetical protein